METLERTWKQISDACELPAETPVAGIGPDDVLFYSWDRGEHHLELEIFPVGTMELFYRNRRTEKLWGDEGQFTPNLPRQWRKFLTIFAT